MQNTAFPKGGENHVGFTSLTMEHQFFFDVIRERRSVRSYDPEIKISREELTEILRQATLAPSAANLQPWRFLVIDSPELKQRLLPIASNQQQVVEASAVIAVLGDLECYKFAEKIYGMAVDAGYMYAETAKSFNVEDCGTRINNGELRSFTGSTHQILTRRRTAILAGWC